MSDEPSQPGHVAGVTAPRSGSRRDLWRLCLAALGIVYGDLGTSPLYTIRECFSPVHKIDLTPANIVGICSIIFWSLLVMVVLKYLTVVMRADNRGEGGIMALLALVMPQRGLGAPPGPPRRVFVLLALFGTALLFADGIITPAISVLSAVEGLEVATDRFAPFIMPITLVILLALFLVQRRGTAGVASVFGPLMLLWFFIIGIVGARWILRQPEVLAAVLPWKATGFFVENGWNGFLALGAVILCVTGTEALYADMGHIGASPIRISWYVLVFPALLCNYLGQGAVLIAQGTAALKSPFYALAPDGFLYPMVVIATIATIIASQALITGSFSLAQQAMQLGYSPRLHIIHTSSRIRGQIYIPEINSLLMICCAALILLFKQSSAMAAAYGVSVMGTMAITTLLMLTIARDHWGTKRLVLYPVFTFFMVVDLAFLGANLFKIAHGGWIPLVIGGCVFAVLSTWKRGRASLAEEIRRGMIAIDEFLPSLASEHPTRVKGTAVFMTSTTDVVPPVLLHHFKHNKVLHEKVILLYIVTRGAPEVPVEERVQVKDLGMGIFQVVGRYGFMQTPNVPQLLELCANQGLVINPLETSYYLGRETLLTTGRARLARWRKRLFSFLSKNARPATAFFGIPPDRVVEMGMQVEL
jgi:KUP system potassium uptake protein